MWFFYILVLIFNLVLKNNLVNKNWTIGADNQIEFICGDPGNVGTNAGGPYDDDPELPELP